MYQCFDRSSSTGKWFCRSMDQVGKKWWKTFEGVLGNDLKVAMLGHEEVGILIVDLKTAVLTTEEGRFVEEFSAYSAATIFDMVSSTTVVAYDDSRETKNLWFKLFAHQHSAYEINQMINASKLVG